MILTPKGRGVLRLLKDNPGGLAPTQIRERANLSPRGFALIIDPFIRLGLVVESKEGRPTLGSPTRKKLASKICKINPLANRDLFGALMTADMADLLHSNPVDYRIDDSVFLVENVGGIETAYSDIDPEKWAKKLEALVKAGDNTRELKESFDVSNREREVMASALEPAVRILRLKWKEHRLRTWSFRDGNTRPITTDERRKVSEYIEALLSYALGGKLKGYLASYGISLSSEKDFLELLYNPLPFIGLEYAEAFQSISGMPRNHDAKLRKLIRDQGRRRMYESLEMPKSFLVCPVHGGWDYWVGEELRDVFLIERDTASRPEARIHYADTIEHPIKRSTLAKHLTPEATGGCGGLSG